ncbi:lysM domain receptor-like kinase 3 [Senna tora]|uniref:LysM domain receptor-like kinase 3 n=1 Tax=Senna tora TaxID=362788 RepID=A0A834TLI3_9FABA|nr:lysM domain receptor-like kinase 3 [Senna tora]
MGAKLRVLGSLGARTPRTRTRTSEPTAQTPNPPSTAPSSSFFFEPSPPNTAHTGFRLTSDTSSFVVSSPTSLPPNLRDTLPQNPNIYHFSEIHSATHNFLPNRFASSSSWRCTLRGRDVMVFRRKFRRRIETAQLRQRLSVICRSHHVSIINLLGASISDGQIYLVYEYVNGANLSDCLRNTHNPRFTVLSNWISRMQVATDIAHGLDYIHNGMGVNGGFTHHNRINSGGIIVTEPSLNAKLCHFGAAQLCGEIDEGEGEIADADADRSSLKPSGSSRTKFEGVRGYMSPEFQSTGVATQKSDVRASREDVCDRDGEGRRGRRRAEEVVGSEDEGLVSDRGCGEGDTCSVRVRPRGSGKEAEYDTCGRNDLEAIFGIEDLVR